MIRKFEWLGDEEIGEGWVPLFLGDSAGAASIIAHDILEHRPGDEPTYEQELMALGRAIFVRAVNGFRDQEPGGWIGNEIGYFLRRGERRDRQRIEPAPRVVDRQRLPDSVVAIIDGAIKHARETLWTEIQPDDREEMRSAIIKRPERQAIRDWLALGFIDAKRRYRGFEPGDLEDLYQRINEKALEPAFSSADEGEYLRVTVNLRRQTAKLERGFYDDRGRLVAEAVSHG
jgi:hypothetical protein